MNPMQIIEKAKALGVSLFLTDDNTIQFRGNRKSIEEVLPLLKTHKSELIQYFEFSRLYDYLSPLYKWGHEDYEVWSADLIETPQLTIDCLKALKNSWEDDRLGCLTPQDWGITYTT